jgi:PTS system D-glucosamine-specific IIC component
MLMHMLNVGVGMTFSGGLIDLTLFGILQGRSRTNWPYIIPVGIIFFIVYFIVFRFMILKFNFETPGREKEDTAPVPSSKEPLDFSSETSEKRSEAILLGLGGISNISDLDCCITRLRITVHDAIAVNKDILSDTGAAAVMISGNAVQIVYGPQVTLILSDLENYIKNDDIVCAPCKGRMIPLADINDGIFSEGYIGKGAAIEPEDGIFYAPFDCHVAMVFETLHAIALKSPKGTELIIHVGLDTVQLGGRYFKVFVQDGDNIKKGDKLLQADLSAIRAAGYRTVTPIIITPASNAKDVQLLTEGSVTPGIPVLDVSYPTVGD